MYRAARAPKQRTPVVPHPTKANLVETAARLLDQHDLDEVTVDAVCLAAGVTKGALYHHFEDYAALLESALVARFAAGVDRTAELVADAIERSTTRDEFLANVRAANRFAQDPARSHFRFERARTLALAERHTRLRRMLAADQERLNGLYVTLITDAQARGFLRVDLDPRAAAVLIQAFTIGRIVDDICEDPIDPDSWYAIVDDLIVRLFT